VTPVNIKDLNSFLFSPSKNKYTPAEKRIVTEICEMKSMAMPETAMSQDLISGLNLSDKQR